MKFMIWKKIEIGIIKNTRLLLEQLLASGCKIGSRANDILFKILFTELAEELRLVVVSVDALGFKNGANYQDICAKAKSFNLGLCPAELGPLLRSQYLDQPKGESLYVAMEPIIDSSGRPRIFWLVLDGDAPWLNGRGGLTDFIWPPERCFIFYLLNAQIK